MKILSLFDGISCARVALERAGIPVEAYYASEIDKYSIEVSKKNWPAIVQVAPVQELDTRPFTDIDLLIGGSPCQDLSIAKKDREGLAGSRSNLFWEFVRIRDEVKPKWWILENVASMPKEARAVITEALGVEPIMIDAALVSAQRRKRLFWTNIPGVTLPEDQGILLKDILENVPVPPEGLEVKDKSKTLRLGGRGSGVGDKHEWDSVYQYCKDGTLKVREATKAGFAIAKEGDAVDLSFPNSSTPRGRVGNKAKNLMTSGTAIHAFQAGQLRRLTPLECERLQSLPDNYTEGVSNTRRYKALGDAFNVEVIKHILSFIPKL